MNSGDVDRIQFSLLSRSGVARNHMKFRACGLRTYSDPLALTFVLFQGFPLA
jgi:hypothetical protein